MRADAALADSGAVTRRRFLQGAGALIVTFGAPLELSAQPGPAGRAAGGIASNQLDSWLAVGPDGGVTVFCGKVELGTGLQTAMSQIVAEELDVAVARVTIVQGDTARTPDQGGTVGSNPDGLRNQIEGNVIQAISRTLKEEVRFDRTGVTSLDWVSYPILTFAEVPESVEIALIDRRDRPPLGAGEPASCPVPGAVANAIFDATGARLRVLPLTPDRVKAALAQA